MCTDLAKSREAALEGSGLSQSEDVACLERDFTVHLPLELGQSFQGRNKLRAEKKQRRQNLTQQKKKNAHTSTSRPA